ncbi:hypothetical protein [Sediminibacter sp. Hel_I_10]|uniref:hypothetical protein n=1 Tax=Sediminibacter sp. Hel_I_10 TaxID=1392490 RepID=UPI000689910C|nr:hypothetical protein [Sediminibacter sp. Hel_I_10]
MKKLYTLVAAVLLTAMSFAQSPEKMSYQAVVRDSGDALVANQAVGMQISILQGSIAGASVYTETQLPTTNINGLVSLEIGNGMIVSGDFSAIDWAAGPYFIKTETDPTGGSSYSITGTSQLLSVPFALYSANTAGLDLKADIASPIFTGNVGIGEDLNVVGNMFSNGGLFLNSWDVFTNSGIFSINESDIATHFNIIPGGNVGIGTSSPTAKLDIAGTVKIVDGTEGAGKVLTSDADGNASWQGTNTLLTTYEATSGAVNPLSADVTGSLIYTQNSQFPNFPEDLPDGFNCTIINYSNFSFTSNVLTTAVFVTDVTGTAGASSFTIPSGGTVNVYVMTNPSNMQKFYYIK